MCKKILYTFLLVTLFVSCTEDKGNYGYVDEKDIIDVSFSGIADRYEVVLGDTLQINPILGELNTNQKHEYLWYIVTRKALNGKMPIRKKLSENVNLNAVINGVDATTYTLYLQVTDVKTGVFVQDSTTLVVQESDISSGWYLLKEQDGMTDIDYIKLTNNKIYSNLLKDYSINGDVRLEGSPVAISYQISGYYHNIADEETGTVTTTALTRIIHVASTKDVRTYQRGNFTLYKDFKEQFYDAPAVSRPQSLFSNSGMFFLNDGELYTTTTALKGIGKYMPARINGGNLSSHMLMWNGYAMLYDESTRSLCYGNNSFSSTTISPFTDKVVDGSVISSSNMNYELIAVPTSLSNATSNSVRTLLMRSVIDNNYYTVDITLDGKSGFDCPLGTFKRVAQDSKVLQSSIFASQRSMIEFYFAVDNSLYYYDHNSLTDAKREVKILDYPSNEIISNISHQRTTAKNMALNVFTYDKNTDTWKMYIHSIPSDNTVTINTTPEAVFSGKGKVKGMFYTGS